MAGISGIDHVQLAMPVGGEHQARDFYARVLGLSEIAKPMPLAARGGVWFGCGAAQLHLGADAAFQATVKVHPALWVDDLPAFLSALQAGGVAVRHDESVNGRARASVYDPFGNRIELIAAP